MSKPLIETLRDAAATAAAGSEIEVVNVELAGSRRDHVVRVYIDKPGGVTLDDCGNFSARVEELLEVDDPMPGRYVLEVSSPGIERELYSIRDFERFKGQLAKVKLGEPVDGQTLVTGVIGEVSGGTVTMRSKVGREIVFPYELVRKANLKIDLGEELKGRKV